MIKVQNVSLKYTKEFFALCDVSLDVKKGETVALLGEEESGKTSFLRILAKLEKYSSGEIYIKNIPLKKLDFKNDISMGYLPATPVFMENKSVKKNLEFVLKGRDFTKYQIEEKINDALNTFGLVKLKDEKVRKLTIFEKYIISIIRLSFRKLELILIDNVFDKVTDSEKEELVKYIDKYFISQKVTTLLATTSDEIASKLCKKIVVFKLGSIVEE